MASHLFPIGCGPKSTVGSESGKYSLNFCLLARAILGDFVPAQKIACRLKRSVELLTTNIARVQGSKSMLLTRLERTIVVWIIAIELVDFLTFFSRILVRDVFHLIRVAETSNWLVFLRL